MTTGPDPLASAAAPFGAQHWRWLCAITALGAALRLWGLGEWSFWVDEGHTWRDATMPLTGPTGFLESDRTLYGLPFLGLRLLLGLGLIGYDEASVRLPFALLGVATIPAMAVCGRRLVGPWAAVAAAGVLAIHPWHIFWSQNARGYVVALLLLTLAVHRAHVWSSSRTLRDLLTAALLLLAAVGCHPTVGMTTVGLLAYFALRRTFTGDARPRARLVAALGVAAALLVVMPVAVRELSPFTGFMRSKADPSLRHFVQTSLFYFRPAFLLTSLVAVLVAPRVLGWPRALFLVCLALGPALALSGISATLVKVTARYGICALPVLTWLSGMLLVEVAVRVKATSRPLAWLIPVALAADLLYQDVAYFATQHGQRAQWREACDHVRAAAAARGLDGVFAVTVNKPAVLYYLRPKHWFLMGHDPHPGFEVEDVVALPLDEPREDGELADPLPYLLQRSGPERQLAVMVTLPELRETDDGGRFERMLRERFELALHLPCWVGPKDESVYVYLPR